MSHSQFHCTGRVYLDLHGLIFETSICYWQDQPGSPTSLPSALGAAAWERVRVRCVGRGCRPQPSRQPPATSRAVPGGTGGGGGGGGGKGSGPRRSRASCVRGWREAGWPPASPPPPPWQRIRDSGETSCDLSGGPPRELGASPTTVVHHPGEGERATSGGHAYPGDGLRRGTAGADGASRSRHRSYCYLPRGARTEESRGCPSRPALGRWLDGPAGAGGSSCPNTGDEPAGRGPPMAGLTGLSTGLSEAPEHSLTCCGLRF